MIAATAGTRETGQRRPLPLRLVHARQVIHRNQARQRRDDKHHAKAEPGMTQAGKAVQHGAGDGERHKTGHGGKAGTPPEKAPALALRHQVAHQTGPQRRGKIGARVINDQAGDQQRDRVLRKPDRQQQQRQPHQRLQHGAADDNRFAPARFVPEPRGEELEETHPPAAARSQPAQPVKHWRAGTGQMRTGRSRPRRPSPNTPPRHAPSAAANGQCGSRENR